MNLPATIAELNGLIGNARPEELPTILGALEVAKAEILIRLACTGPISSRSPHPDEEKLLTMAAAAAILGVPEEHAREMGRRGELATVPVGRYVRVRSSSLMTWIESNERGGGGVGRRRNSARTKLITVKAESVHGRKGG